MTTLEPTSRALRHPEKQKRADNPIPKKPAWIRVKAPAGRGFGETRKLMREKGLHTVCEEASCPNIGECWEKKHATVMILGDTCTRACAFCDVKTGKPGPVNEMEPARVAETAREMELRHMVITSVDRDDLSDGGADQFARCIRAVREASPDTTIEVLTPDFRKKEGALEIVVAAKPDVFNHNLETVPRLYKSIRPGADFAHSLSILKRAKEMDPHVFTKSGIMVGLGETIEEVWHVMDAMREANIDFITIGQYLAPSPKHAAIERFVTPDEFDELKTRAEEKGFLLASCSPLTRSSHHADRDFAELRARREAALKGA